MQIELRSYQEKSVDLMRRNFSRDIKNQILSLPTGSGKTVLAAFMMLGVYEKGKKAIFVCDRISLINQTSNLLDNYGIPHGVIQADHWRYRPYERIQVASVQTLSRRTWPESDLIIIDEAHCLHESTKKILSEKKSFAIGLTATPFTRGLGKIYSEVVTVSTMNQLTAENFLVPFRIFAPSEPDMTGAKTVAGEWTDTEAESRSLPIVGDCVAEYLRHGDGKKFICFGVTVKHCEELHKKFMAAGVNCELYTYKQGDEAKSLIMNEFRKSDSNYRGLISVSALAKGLDVPDIGVVILARPLRKSLAEHIQMLGRGLRPAAGKKDCVILDHSGNCVRFYEEMTDFFENGLAELDDGKPKKKAEKKPKAKKPLKCPSCACVHDSRPACPSCGYLYPLAKKSGVFHQSGDLIEFGGTKNPVAKTQDDFYSELMFFAYQKGWKEGAIAHIFKNKTGYWPTPSMKNLSPKHPSNATLNEIRKQVRHYYKSKKE